MSWHAKLSLDYRHEAGSTVLRHQHTGPLRVLQSLYPEGPAVCHNVLVHPPGGLVGGDTLTIGVDVQPHAHGLITTPGATRFYRCDDAPALQSTHLALAENARLEWLPLEAICHSGCLAENRLSMALQPGAELIGWDITALGLPHANQPFAQGRFQQHIELGGVWLERALIDAHDTLLLDGAAGMAGQRCIASLFFTTGSALARERRQGALESARAVIASHPLSASAGVTSPNPQVIVLRTLAPVVEPAMDLLKQVRRRWRQDLWNAQPVDPRIWAM